MSRARAENIISQDDKWSDEKIHDLSSFGIGKYFIVILI